MFKKMTLTMSSVVLLGIAMTGCASDATSGDEPQTSETSADATVCWPTAGLYWNACDTSLIREDIHAGEQVDFLSSSASCNGETWWNVVHHATGHHGWVRLPAVCGF